ncbi:CopD family protein [Bradyrhizobium diazoefficiens]|nr:CopD family protein [Bradyrhizobium diazoefficiens]
MPREVTDALKNQGHWRATPLETRVTNLNNYDWIKALHVVAVMIWMAGMLPWLFVLHGDAAFGSCTSEFLKVVERRLLRAIVNPAMILAWIAGPYLAWSAHWWTAGWFQTKFALVLALSGVHGLYARWVKDFAADRPRKSRGTYLGAALIPTVVMIAAVVLVVVKPF